MVVECGDLDALAVVQRVVRPRGGRSPGPNGTTPASWPAQDGTVFLDEIDTMPLECQAKLLRTVDDRVYQAVGSNRPQSLRARLIVATNRPLDQEVSAGRFRSDLYYRLNVVAFPIPPLRERHAEIQPLAERFLAILWQRADPPFADSRAWRWRPCGATTGRAIFANCEIRWNAAWHSAVRPRSIWRTFPSRSSRLTSEVLAAAPSFPLGDGSCRQQAGRCPYRRRIATAAGSPGAS